ncbi:efflux RND transporter periplasmic adaptor subunit [Lignipirellula cremea]|uniref:Dihydrolipoamide acetyltransferase n=1 Tax=Lignipirellula cremea TaxID=2528010 RepID=A0A518E4G6_9BACT|nr:HlyD family efflux transporter periplasmic adaptor subunit [Lignipirellula cremea]QDU98987.1 dihydrolipoamide acetyltransferase [Lignipirellula cremea]
MKLYPPRLFGSLSLLLAGALPVWGEEIQLSDCIVSLKEQVLVPARQAGVLTSLTVREGSRTVAGESIAQVDDAEQTLEQDLALVQQSEYAEKAASDIDIRYAKAAEEVALAELQAALDVNQRVGGTLPQSEVRRFELAARKAKLLVERSESEKRLAGLALRGQNVTVNLARKNVSRCQVVSSISGEVIALKKQEGEWVNLGDPIAHVVRLDTLRVEGFVTAASHDPIEIVNQPVVATVKLAHGRQAQFAGRIVFVRPVVQGGGQFLVCAEVANRTQDGHWLLRPGMLTDMTIGAEAEGKTFRPRNDARPVDLSVR